MRQIQFVRQSETTADGREVGHSIAGQNTRLGAKGGPRQEIGFP